MEKILLLTDSACDIPLDVAHDLGIRVMPIPIEVDGAPHHDGDFTLDEFYDILERCKKIPTTSHINYHQILQQYLQADEQGYTHLLHVTINAQGSNMIQAANHAKELFAQQRPHSAMHIRIIDSGTYSVGYGFPLTEAARMLQKGVGYAAVRDYLLDWFGSLEIYFSVYSLDFVKKSGRVSCTAAFVGDILGLRPIIRIMDGRVEVVDKVRGDAKVVPALAGWAQKQMCERSPYATLCARYFDRRAQLTGAMQKALGYPPVGEYRAGAYIAINAGPQIIGVMVKGHRRR